MGFGTAAEVKSHKEINIPGISYVGVITSAEDKISKQASQRPFTSLAIKIEDSVPGGQDVDDDLFLDPYDSTVFTNLYTVLQGDNKFFANNASKTNKSFLEATDDLTECDDIIGLKVGFTVAYNKKTGEQNIARFFKV